MNKKAIVLLLATALGAPAAHAQKAVKATRSLPILEYATSARSAALGGNHYGESDVAHLYTNARISPSLEAFAPSVRSRA